MSVLVGSALTVTVVLAITITVAITAFFVVPVSFRTCGARMA